MAHNAPIVRLTIGQRHPWLFGVGLGLFATWVQITILREAMTLGGGSEIALGLGLGGWLLGVGAGALLGLLPPPRPASLVAVAALSGPLAAGTLLGLRLHRALLGLPPGEELSLAYLAVVSIIGAGLAGATAGLLFTVAARATGDGRERSVTRLYLGEASGALIAGAIHTFLLAGAAGALSIIGAGFAILVAGCSLLSGSARGRASAALVALPLLAAAWPGESFPLARLDRRTTAAAFDLLGAGGRLLDTRESPYGRLALGERGGQYQLFADGLLDHVFPDPWDSPVALHIALAAHPRPRRVLLLGGAVPDRLETVLAWKPERVVLTFLDGAVPDLCRPYWPARTVAATKDPRVELVIDDSRRYVNRAAERFDLVVVAAPAPTSARENRFHTLEFFTALARILEPGGIAAVRAAGGATVLAPEAARSLAGARATVERVFPHTLMVPDVETWILASAREIDADPEVMAARFGDISVPGFSASRFSQILVPARLRSFESQLEHVAGKVNTDREPAGYLAGLELWERHSSGPGMAAKPTWIGSARQRSWTWLSIALLAWAVWRAARFAPGRRRPPSGGPRAADAVFATGVTGAAGMGITVVTLYAFQAAAGTVYTTLGLVVGLFMAGLAAGALAGGRWLAPRPALAGIVATGAMLVFLLATGPVIGALLAHPWPIVAWAALGGAVTGAAFPAYLSAASGGGDERRVAGAVESADHLGAAFGAFAVGVIWLPVHGLMITCMLLAAFQAAGLVGLLLPSRR